jgi:hypothetical protein
MQSIRTPFLYDDQVPEGFTPMRVEIALQDGRIVFETVWLGEREPVSDEDVPY